MKDGERFVIVHLFIIEQFMFTVKRVASAVIFYLMTHALAVNVSLLSELPSWNNIMSGNYALCVVTLGPCNQLVF